MHHPNTHNHHHPIPQQTSTKKNTKLQHK